MSTRRMARTRDLSSTVGKTGGVPRSLLIGRCIEVWSGPSVVDFGPAPSTYRRFNVARGWWLDTAGIESSADQCKLIPLGAPWSVDYLMDDQADHAGMTGEDVVAERLARAGATVEDIDALRAEAVELFERAESEQRSSSKK